jgi:hypothetical protein
LFYGVVARGSLTRSFGRRKALTPPRSSLGGPPLIGRSPKTNVHDLNGHQGRDEKRYA